MKTLVLNGNTRRWFAFLSDLLRLIMILAATNGHTLSGYAVDRARTGSEYIFAALFRA